MKGSPGSEDYELSQRAGMSFIQRVLGPMAITSAASSVQLAAAGEKKLKHVFPDVYNGSKIPR